jgi:hypothetical protein
MLAATLLTLPLPLWERERTFVAALDQSNLIMLYAVHTLAGWFAHQACHMPR